MSEGPRDCRSGGPRNCEGLRNSKFGGPRDSEGLQVQVSKKGRRSQAVLLSIEVLVLYLYIL